MLTEPFVEEGPSHLCESCFCCEQVGSSKQDWDLCYRKLFLHLTLTWNQKKYLKYIIFLFFLILFAFLPQNLVLCLCCYESPAMLAQASPALASDLPEHMQETR